MQYELATKIKYSIVLRMETKARAVLEEVYKIYDSMCPTYLNDQLKRCQNMHDTRNKNLSVQTKCQTTRYGIDFYLSGGANSGTN